MSWDVGLLSDDAFTKHRKTMKVPPLADAGLDLTPDEVVDETPLRAVFATWILWATVLATIAATYTRLGPGQLYNMSGDGFSAAMSRVLVEMNYPLALVAIAIVLLSLDVLGTRWRAAGGIAIALCLVTAWPGVVDESDLDARWINAVPALGVLIAIALSIVAAANSGLGAAPRLAFDKARIAIAAVVILVSLPWIAADLGFYFPDGIFITERAITGSDGMVNPAVHLGHHHGFDGSLIVLSALLLSRGRVRSNALRLATRLFVALMFAYGTVNMAQDFTNEQWGKRGWIDWEIPNAVSITFTPVWLAILGFTAIVAVLLGREGPGLQASR